MNQPGGGGFEEGVRMGRTFAASPPVLWKPIIKLVMILQIAKHINNLSTPRYIHVALFGSVKSKTRLRLPE